jgi:hypothetical protein
MKYKCNGTCCGSYGKPDKGKIDMHGYKGGYVGHVPQKKSHSMNEESDEEMYPGVNHKKDNRPHALMGSGRKY